MQIRRAAATRAPLLTSAVLALLLAGLAGCGSDDGDAKDTAPASTPGAVDGAGDDETDTPSGGLIDVCTEITDAEVAAIVGNPVTRKEVPGGGCSFDQEDLRAPTLAFNTSVNDDATGGFDGAVSGAKGVLTGASGGEVSGVGDRAYVATGTSMGGSNQQGSGLVQVGTSLVQVTLVQGNGLSAAAVKALVVDALELSASKG